MALKEFLREIKPVVYVLLMLFAIACWIDIQGLWVEVPLMVNALPEGWKLPSYLTAIMQGANIGPIVYTIIKRCWPKKVLDWHAVYVIISVGAISCLLLVFFWDRTSYFGGELHSTGLFTLCFFLALVDCTSSVAFLPYMGMYKPHYMTAYYIGEGLCALIPGTIGLAQGVGQDPLCVNTSMINKTTNETYYKMIPDYPPPNFSVATFMLILFAFLCLSGTAFSLVHWLPYCKTERVTYDLTAITTTINADNSGTNFLPCLENTVKAEQLQIDSEFETIYNQHRRRDAVNKAKRLTKTQETYLLTMASLACCLQYGVLLAFMPFFCLPHGSLAYTLSVRLATCAHPLASFIALLAPRISLAGVGVFAALGTIISVFQIVFAAMSPYPPLQGEAIGVVLVVSTSVLVMLVHSYVRVSVAIIIREFGGPHALSWLGVATQIGFFVGSIVAFICVNTANLFTSAEPCPI